MQPSKNISVYACIYLSINSSIYACIYASIHLSIYVGKAGMYVKNVPSWITNAYKKNVVKASKWRSMPAKFEKDTSGDVKPIMGRY